jgi:hypothetical protein
MGDQFAAEESRNAQIPAPARASPRRCDTCKKQQDLREPAGRSDNVSAQLIAENAQSSAGRLLDLTACLSSGPDLGHSISRIPVITPAGTAKGEALQQDTGQRFGHDFSRVLVHSVGAPAAVRREAERGLVGPEERLPFLDAIQRSFGHHSLESVHAHIDGSAARAS